MRLTARPDIILLQQERKADDLMCVPAEVSEWQPAHGAADWNGNRFAVVEVVVHTSPPTGVCFGSGTASYAVSRGPVLRPAQ